VVQNGEGDMWQYLINLANRSVGRNCLLRLAHFASLTPCLPSVRPPVSPCSQYQLTQTWTLVIDTNINRRLVKQFDLISMTVVLLVSMVVRHLIHSTPHPHQPLHQQQEMEVMAMININPHLNMNMNMNIAMITMKLMN
jgi:hypothetical protein